MFEYLVAELLRVGAQHATSSQPFDAWGVWQPMLTAVETRIDLHSLYAVKDVPDALKLRIVEAAFLQTAVNRISKIDGAAENLTYGDLEMCAGVFLQPADPKGAASAFFADDCRVYMPPTVLRQILLTTAFSNFRWASNLRNLLQDYVSPDPVWQQWEVFVAQSEALQLSLWERRRERAGTSSPGFMLGDFLGISRIDAHKGPPQLQWRLYPRCDDVDVLFAQQQFPSTLSLTTRFGGMEPVQWDTGNVIVNGVGAEFADCFVVLDAVAPDDTRAMAKRPFVLAFQCRYRQDGPTLKNLESDLEQHEKKMKVIRDSSPDLKEASSLLVEMYPLVQSKLSLEEVAALGPCVLLAAEGVAAHFGPVLSEVGTAMLKGSRDLA